jgi:hypothetical protein
MESTLMHGTARRRTPDQAPDIGVNAVAWIEPGRAIVVRGGDRAELTSIEIRIPAAPAITPPALAEVAHSIGAVDRVLVLGEGDLRTALEREIVAIGHRPETIREAEVTGPVDAAVLAERLGHLR